MFSTTSSLSLAARADALDRLAHEDLDILVIGAGVTGCGCALDAVTRGLRVGLVEARDFAAGTSSRSSKLFHGGLRYLEQLNFALVFEALRSARWPSTSWPRIWPSQCRFSTRSSAGDRPRLWRPRDRRVRRTRRRTWRTAPHASPEPQAHVRVLPPRIGRQ